MKTESKLQLTVCFAVLACLLLLPLRARANDYLEQSGHYTVMSLGQGVIRYTVPLWVYGSVNDYYLYCSADANDPNDSYLWYSSSNSANRGGSDIHRFVSVYGERYGNNDNSSTEGEGWIRVHEGSVIIQSMYDGTKRTVTPAEGWVRLSLKRKEDDGHKRITYLQFDWYPPSTLDNQTFYTGISVADYKKSSGNRYETYWWRWAERFTGSNMPQSPELIKPYLYVSDGKGQSRVGCAAIQYVTYQEPISYTTSLNSSPVSTKERSDVIVVPMADTVQRFFSATFNVWTDKNAGASRTLRTNTVNIPAYHKIYNFQALAGFDAQQSTTGVMQLSWDIHTPSAEDIVENDVFEVQRALKSDFSDAQSLRVVNYSKDSASYHISDNALQALASASDDASVSGGPMTVTETVPVYGKDGDVTGEYTATMKTQRQYSPGRTVYYRIRRASSSFRGWNHDYVQDASVVAYTYLAPLASAQPEYTLDPDFESNRKVHFGIRIENTEVPQVTIPVEDCEFSCELSKAYVDSIPVAVTIQGPVNPNYQASLEVRAPESSTVDTIPMVLQGNQFIGYVHGGCDVTIRFTAPFTQSVSIPAVSMPIRAQIQVIHQQYMSTQWSCSPITYQVLTSGPEVERLKRKVSVNTDSVKNEVYQQMLLKAGSLAGTRCAWDKNARLFLRKVHVENADTMRILIPYDSISRQPDGSWLARYTDVANLSCTHYSYAVYIDQSASPRKVWSSTLLQPKTITGPELYRNTAATVNALTATQGTDKTCVLLKWVPGGGSVDEYRIWRKDAEMSSFEKISTTDKASYRDTEAVPDKHYTYMVEAVLTCNGTTTVRSATTTGWRSPYGSISGYIRYADGIACPDVTVTVTGGGQTKTVTTNQSGAFFVDSLLYGSGTTYSIVPTSQTAQFVYGNTGTPGTTAKLTTSHPVAEDVMFTNISSVRVTGRVLFENSTIPVRDATFLLNGNPLQNVNGPVRTDVSGNFSISVPSSAAFTLQVQKDGHLFDGDGFVRMNGSTQLSLTQPLDGVRLWDKTKVRLMGRVAGGMIQASKPIGFGLSTNNLGDNIRLVLELEGDNISSIVSIPTNQDKDTLQFDVDGTHTLFQKKRITISVNPATGEYKADLYPVRYKVIQATAQGYATLFAAGKSNETIDLTGAATADASVRYQGATAKANAIYSITYRSPIDITCTQMRYGMAQDFYGEEVMSRQNLQNQQVDIPLAEKDSTGTYRYLFGAPVFMTGNYEFNISAHEDYYYNNDPNSVIHEQVPVEGGKLTVYNGLHDAIKTQIISSALDAHGEAQITIPVDYVSFVKTGETSLRVLDLSVESDGAYIEKQAFKAYITGNRSRGRDFMTNTHGSVQLLDILRDPPGSNSSAYVEAGTTYKYNYTFDLSVDFGLNLKLGYGASANMAIGTYSGVGAGVFAGNVINASTVNRFNLPIKSSYYYKRQGSYTFETSDRIETSSDPYYVGQDADVYIGLTQNVYYDITDAVKPIDSVTYEIVEPQVTAGTMQLISTGRDRDGKLYYLVTGREIAVGPYLNSTFHYTHRYIRDVLIPNLVTQRNALLLDGDSATIQAIADAQRKAVYWAKVQHTDSAYAVAGGYRQLIPSTMKDRVWPDEIDAYNRQIFNWTKLLLQNETEKVNAIHSAQSEQVGNYSVSYATTTSHNETYAFSNTYTSKVDYPGASVNFGQGVLEALGNIGEAVKVLLFQRGANAYDDDGQLNEPYDVINQAPGSKIEFEITPLFNINFGRDPNRTEGQTKKTGFTLKTGDYAYMDVSVFRVVNAKDTFNSAQAGTGAFVSSADNGYNAGDKLYGSYVYRLNGGASRCPWEQADSTHFYTPKIPLSAGTQNLENLKLDINVHERSFVPHDKPAVFNLTISNEGTGNPNELISFTLKLKDDSNPKGAKIYIDGQPLSGQGRTVWMTQGTVYNKTMEVYAGPDYDYENLTIQLHSQCNIYNISSAVFSVHYTPVSSPVNISTPHDKWVLNTLSPYDERGYYLPVTIDGFDINYRGFDHIELQYKVSTQSDEAWVNLCSYYADSALYQAASGTKAMIKSGKIETARFYGERDPIEQQYDLRAVSFSRVGTSFVTRSSAVLKGVKDTRQPRVFGEPEPANAILGVGDNLLLRFNEAIAGNYLDEDNNFQIRGVTNATGISTNASAHFSGGENSYAQSQVSRILSGSSFTIDMMVKPTDPNANGTFFYHSDDIHSLSFGMTASKQLFVTINGQNFVSKPIEPMMQFTRVIFVLNTETRKARFYAGTKDVTDPNYENIGPAFEYNVAAPLCFGRNFNGNILEARLWSTALSQEEIAATHMRSLTGYERELLAYYRMNEGMGTTIKDYANGATLTMTGASWTLPKGYAMAIDTTTRAIMAHNLLSRPAAYDATYMFWFRAGNPNGTIFSVGDKHFTLDDGALVFHYGENGQVVSHNIISDTWYHLVWVINRTYNTFSIYLDNELTVSGSADELSGITGDMYLGGNGFRGHIDEFVVFEQALPKTLIEEYGNRSPVGDEMGLMAYLPFEQQSLNPNGILELFFSINDQRRFRDPNGNVISVTKPLLTGLEVDGQLTDQIATDQTVSADIHAPVHGQERLSKLNFDWSFNNDELMINLNMPDREINKQTVYVTVRDVEDVNGNPMASPVMWLAYVDRNSIKWAERELIIYANYGEKNDSKLNTREMKILNNSGKRHQFTIESLPAWLKVDRPYGSLQPTEDKTLVFTYDVELAVGVHSDLIYLTDGNGLSEPLRVQLVVEAQCPWDEVNAENYPNTMNIRGQVKLNDKIVNGQTVEIYDTDPNDVIAVFSGNELVGKAYNTFDNTTSKSFVYLTVHGNSSMSGKMLSFKLWQASTGKVFNLRPSALQRYQNNAIRGYAPDAPVQFSTYAGETQQVSLNQGWNWLSFYLKPQPDSLVNTVFADGQGWTKGDLLKTPSERQVAEFDGSAWKGTLQAVNYRQMYMAKASAPTTVSIEGALLSDAERTVTLYNGWSSIAYLLDQPMSVQDALADYLVNATVGDVIKSKNAVAVFSENRRWEGSLQTMTPGQGYLFRRLNKNTVTMTYYPKATTLHAQQSSEGKNSPPKVGGVAESRGSMNNYPTNMTMVARLSTLDARPLTLLAYQGDELVGVATPQVVDGDTLFFLTISAEHPGTIHFMTSDGQELAIVNVAQSSIVQSSMRSDSPKEKTVNCQLSTVNYSPNSHYGTIEEPVILMPLDEQQPQKIMEDGQFYILMPDGTRYSATGKQM